MLPNIFWSRTDYISGAYATKTVAISSPADYITTGFNLILKLWIRFVFWAPNQHILIISEWECDIEDWSNNCLF